MPDVQPHRRRLYVALALGTIAIGLLVHLHGMGLNAVARDVAGDALWAAMIAWWVGALAPVMRASARGVLAYVVCAAVEVSQLYHTPGLDGVRATRLGHLLLGSGFDPRDLVAYAIGVAGTVFVEAAVARIGVRRHQRDAAGTG
jgi:hypothetical protein